MAESVRMQQLKKLATAMPVANQAVASGLQQAQQTQLQQAIKTATPTAGATAAQTVGGQQATAMAAPVVQAQANTQQQVGQVANIAQNQAGIESQQRVGQQQSAVSNTARQNAAKLAALDNDVKNQLLDQQLTFNKDERGRTLLNDRQLADVAILKAKTEEDIAAYKQNVDQMNARKLQAMQAAYHKLAQTLKSGVAADGQRLDFQTKQEIKTMMNEAEKSIQKAKNDAEAKAAMWAAAGTVVGTVVGAYFGGAGGAKAGGQAGGAAGGYAGSQ